MSTREAGIKSMRQRGGREGEREGGRECDTERERKAQGGEGRGAAITSRIEAGRGNAPVLRRKLVVHKWLCGFDAAVEDGGILPLAVLLCLQPDDPRDIRWIHNVRLCSSINHRHIIVIIVADINADDSRNSHSCMLLLLLLLLLLKSRG